MAEEPQTGKKSNAPKPKFGQMLEIAGQYWTVQSAEGGKVNISRRVGDTTDERIISAAEYETAAARPLPKSFGLIKPPKGISVGSFVPAGRVIGFDAMTGDVQIEAAGTGPTWISSGGASSASIPTRPAGGRKHLQTAGEGTVKGEEQGNVIDRWVRRQASDLTYGAVPRTASAKRAAEAIEEKKPDEKVKRVEEEEEEEEEPKKPVVKVEEKKEEKKVETKEPTVRQTREELKVQIEEAGKIVAPGIAAAGLAGAAVAKTVPSAPRVKAAPFATPATSIPTAPVLGVAVSVFDTIAAQPPPDATRANEQQQLYAKAMNALDIVSSRAAEKRRSIQEMQTQAGSLQTQISALNAQTPTPSSNARIREMSKQLGGLQNKLAMARYGVQTDEARSQQLRIATNLMRNVAPEVRSGQVPRSIIGLVEQSIPADIPSPSPARAAGLIAGLQESHASANRMHPQTANIKPHEAIQISTPKIKPPVLSDAVRARMKSGGLTLPQSTAVAMSAAQQSDRAGASRYSEGIGSPDARAAAFFVNESEGGRPRPVMETIQKSYTDAEAPEEAADVFQPSGEGRVADFARRQREKVATQEQFLPGTTGGLEPATFAPEIERGQRVRSTPEEPEEEAMRAAKMQADSERLRAAAMQALGTGEEEEQQLNAKRRQGLFKQAEAAKRNFSRLMDLFDAAHGLEDIVGLFAVLGNMNMRVLTMGFREKSITRKIFPPAQFPVEAAGIAAMDILVFIILFVSFCMVMAPIVIWAVIVLGSAGGIISAVAS